MAFAIYLLFFASGAAALGYQLVWARMFTVGLGHELPSVLAVVCAFMGGMGVGSWLLARPISAAATPVRWYGGLELVIGAWGLVSIFLIPLASKLALGLIGLEPAPWRHWTFAFLIPFAVLLPSTCAIGATFAAMERMVQALRKGGVLSSVAPVYAANTAGAVAGTLLSAFVLMPALGFRRTLLGLAAVNLGCGLAAYLLRLASTAPSLAREPIPRRLAAMVFFTGLLAIAYETTGIRVLATVLENTIYTFAGALATFLLGASIGAVLYHRWAPRSPHEEVASRLLMLVAAACSFGLWPIFWSFPLYGAAQQVFGRSATAELVVSLAVFLVPAMAMGALFSHLVQTAARTVAGVGRLTAVNTFGAALAPAVIGVGVFPLLGAKWTLLLVASGYIALVPKWGALRWTPIPWLVIGLSTLGLDLRLLRTEEKVIDYRDGVMASVVVLEDKEGERRLRINNRFQQGGTGAANAEYRQAQMPLLLHPAPRQALFLGVGTGITLGAATLHSNLHAHGVELVPEVLQMLRHFESANFQIPQPPSVTASVADARRFVRASTNRYEVIVADLFHPAMEGAGFLYTVEHFEAIRARLASDGLFCQWLPLFQLDEELVRVIAKTFVDVFPNSQAWLLRFNIDAPVLGLFGWMSPIAYGGDWIEKRLADPTLERRIRHLTLSDSVRFFGHALLDGPTLRAFCNDAPSSTDDAPLVVFRAPHVTHEATQPYRSLGALLELPFPDPAAVLPAAMGHTHARVVASWKARHRYLYGLVAEQTGREGEAIDAYVESARLSPDFTLGYARCATLASIRARTNPLFARQLLERLMEAQPEQELAADMLKRLGR